MQGMKALARVLPRTRVPASLAVRAFSQKPPQQNVFTGPAAAEPDVFEELKDEQVETKESAAKNLSLKLLNVRPLIITR